MEGRRENDGEQATDGLRAMAGRRDEPAGVRSGDPVAGLRAESVDALSLDEALLLARELPHLRALIQ